MTTLPSRGALAALVSILAALAAAGPARGADDGPVRNFLDAHCVVCHDGVTKKGGLDLSDLVLDLAAPGAMARWVAIHDRVRQGEMPPAKAHQPGSAERAGFVDGLRDVLTGADRERARAEGRATRRRLNRSEYENAVRDLLGADWLPIREILPEDGEAHRFSKVGEALDVSHVQMARYLTAADEALRQVVPTSVDRPASKVTRYYARDQRAFTGKMKFNEFNQRAERATFPTLDAAPQPDVRAGKAPLTVGKDDPATRDREGVGVVASTYEPLEIRFNAFKAPASGRYRLRFSTQSVWVGPGKDPKRWFIPDLDSVAPGRRSEPVAVYAEVPPRQMRRVGAFDARPEPGVSELEVDLLEGETIRPDAARLFRSRPPNWVNPLAEKDGCPGVTFRWLEVEGPIVPEWPTAAQTLLFGDLRVEPGKKTGGPVEVVPSADSLADARRLLRRFCERAYRRPVAPGEEDRFVPIVDRALKAGYPFRDALLAGYTGVLCSPEFVSVEERPGRLDDHALATRLALFLTNSPPDPALRARADRGELGQPGVLRAEANRLLDGSGAHRFFESFLDQWLDLRKIGGASPDETLYADYYLDDLLIDSARDETRAFFAELVKGDLPAREVVAADFAMLNDRLAVHYGLPPVEGVAIRRVALPPDSPRGGLLTQASVLTVTANGMTTSPVLRGVWVMERILGQPLPPPPPGVAAVEPDVRGATTIREQLARHRSDASCNSCHKAIDPPGFALENFDVMGGWRDHYRALTGVEVSNTAPSPLGLGHNGQRFVFRDAAAVDPAGVLADGRAFRDIRELKQALAGNDDQLARNLVRQFVVYATGAPVGFADRAAVEAILDRTRPGRHGVRSLILGVVESDLFREK